MSVCDGDSNRKRSRKGRGVDVDYSFERGVKERGEGEGFLDETGRWGILQERGCLGLLLVVACWMDNIKGVGGGWMGLGMEK